MTINIDDLIKLGEGYHLEFKESIDKSFAKEVCAFANASGGKILLGVTDKGFKKNIVLDNQLHSRIQDTINHIEPRCHATVSQVDGIVMIDVAAGLEKPYGCSDGFFIRIGANSQKLTRNEIIQFFQKEGRIRFDELENNKAVFAKDFTKTLYDNFLEKAGISTALDTNQLLTNLGCMVQENKLTNAGVLFFCESIEFLIPHATVTCILYQGTEKLRILDRKDFQRDIAKNIEDAIAFVFKHTNLAYRIEHIRREEILEFPEVAIREAVVNAVCHRDYFAAGVDTMVEVFKDRVEITNPGGLPSGLTSKTFGTMSRPRNPTIANLLLRSAFIEKAGTGINRIKDAVKEHGYSKVKFVYDEHHFKVVFIREQEAKLRAEFGEVSGNMSVEMSGNMSVEILTLIKNNPKITIPQMATALKITTRTVERHLASLKRAGQLQRIGFSKGGSWKIIEN